MEPAFSDLIVDGFSCIIIQRRPSGPGGYVKVESNSLSPRFFVLFQVMSELMTRNREGWTPLVFASRSGSRTVFVAIMEAFIERGEEGSRMVSGRGGTRSSYFSHAVYLP